MDEFVYSIESDSVDQKLWADISTETQVDGKGYSDWFLGTYLEWSTSPTDDLSVYTYQYTFEQHTSESFSFCNFSKDPLPLPRRNAP